MKKELFIVLGNSQTGKSVTIRGLTGMWKKGKCKIETNNGVIDIYVFIRALQEVRLTPDDAVKELREHKRLLIPLRILGGRICPGALEYIQAFINEDFTVSQLVALGDNQDDFEEIRDKYPQLQYIHTLKKIKDMPNNHAACQIRDAWDWR